MPPARTGDDVRRTAGVAETQRAKALLTLLDRRPELREVIALADFTGERVLWCA